MKSTLLAALISLSFFSTAFSQIVIPSALYTDNFDSLNIWTDTSYNSLGSSWELGTPNYGVTNSTHSGINSWDISLDSAYKPNTEAILTSPFFDFSGVNVDALNLSFWANQNTQNDSDGLRIECSENGGPWQVMGMVGDVFGTNWYNSTNIGNTAKPGWTGNSGGWVKRSYNLTPYFGGGLFQMRFVFTSDGTIENDGLSIDDFGIEWAPVTINFISDSIGSQCAIPQTVKLVCNGTANSGVLPPDSVLLHIFFGDGTDTTFYEPLTPFGSFNAAVYHTYNLFGSYTVAYIATNSIGDVDTLISPSQVVLYNNCGNISGNIYADLNNNCINDPSDSLLYQRSVHLYDTSSAFSIFTFTDAAGFYSFSVPAGYVYDVTFASPLNNTTICPGLSYTGITALPSVNNDFALGCPPGVDLSCQLSSVNYRPGFNRYLNLTALNFSCLSLNAIVKLLLDTDLTYVSAVPTPSQIVGDTLIWNLNPFQLLQSFSATIEVQTDSQAVLGTYLYNTCIIEPITGDVNGYNNIYTTSGLVVNSYDPNEKTVNPPGDISTNQTFTYTINFQNTGNDVAYNIFILDTLDAGLDASSFTPIASSDTMITEILNGKVLHFMFNNIYLPDSGSNEPASHGFVTYTVKPLATLNPGTQIKNTSYIYFDFNDPIVTNTTSNTISLIASNNEIVTSKNNLIVYPNPANDKIEFKLNDTHQKISNIEITNALGQIVFDENTSTSFLNIKVSKWNPGIYFYRIVSDQQEYFSGKFMVSK